MSRDPGKEALERMSFKLYFDMRPQFDEMTDAEAGKIVKACFAYILDAVDTDFSSEDRLVRSFWTSTKLKLDGQNRDRETKSANGKRAANVRWNGSREGRDSPDTDTEGEESECIQTHTDVPTIQNNTEQHRTGPVHNSTGTRTDTKQIQVTDSVIDSAERCAVAAGNAAPLAHDSAGLFTIEQLRKIVQSKKIPITDDGLNAFHEEMTDSEWTLYGEPVERKYIARALRGWLKYHQEYVCDDSMERDVQDNVYDNVIAQGLAEKANKTWDTNYVFTSKDIAAMVKNINDEAFYFLDILHYHGITIDEINLLKKAGVNELPDVNYTNNELRLIYAAMNRQILKVFCRAENYIADTTINYLAYKYDNENLTDAELLAKGYDLIQIWFMKHFLLLHITISGNEQDLRQEFEKLAQQIIEGKQLRRSPDGYYYE